MPYTPKQKALFGAELARIKAGKPTKTGMAPAQLERAIHEPTKRPQRKPK